VPHFEKMLYDQAQITSCALDTWRATGDERSTWLARGILEYVLRDLTSPEGAFYSAEDADSRRREGSEPVEGAFYVWTTAEMDEALGADAAFAADHFGAKPGGNVAPSSDPHGEFTGSNILAQVRPLTETARIHKMEPQAANDLLVSCLARLQAAMDAAFWDTAKGGYFTSAAGADDVVVRLKEDYDGAEPAATSVAALNLFRLSSLTGDEGLRDRGRMAIAAFRSRWETAPHAMPQLLCAFESALEPPRHVVITGKPESPGFAALAAAARERLGPRRTLVALDAPGAREFFSKGSPWLALLGVNDDRPTAYVCEEFICRTPARTPDELRKVIGA
jgi:uncharacterized protein YyaL (SSP411 family)